MIRLRKATASQEIHLGTFVDAADGFTAETGLTIANTDIKLWKNGTTAVVSKNSGGATHDAQGLYSAVLDATDTSTVGPLVIIVHVAGARPVRVECEVLEAALYDSLFGAIGIHAEVRSIFNSGTAAAKLQQAMMAVVNCIAAGGGTTTSHPVGLAEPGADAVVANQWKDKVLTFLTDTPTVQLRGQSRRIISNTTGATPTIVTDAFTVAASLLDVFVITDGVISPLQTGDNFARLGAPAGASVSADVAAVKGVLPAALTGGGNMKSDALALNGSTTAAARLDQSARTIVLGTATPASTGTSLVTSGLDPAATVTDQFKGRVLIFRSDTTTAALRGQATRITASTAGGVLTVDQLTTIPNNDSFVIV